MTVVKVAVNKRFRRSNLGLKFVQHDEHSPLTISKISEGGLFDETPLVQGLVVLKINDEDVTWMSPRQADKILHKTKKGRITVTAEGFVGKIVRHSQDEKIGIVLHKPTDSCDDIFIWQIKGHSKFRATDLKPGMKIITINGYHCPSSPVEAIKLMQRTIGKLKIVAVEINRQKPMQHSSTRIRIQVNSRKAAGSSHDETKNANQDVKETVSIVPSSITSVSGFCTVSSKQRIRQRVKAVFKPLVKGARSTETEETTESSAESVEKHPNRTSHKKSKIRLFQKLKPKEEINLDEDISDLDEPVIEERPEWDQAYSNDIPSTGDIPVIEFESHKNEESESFSKHSLGDSHKKSKTRVFRKTKQINIVSYGDIPDSEDDRGDAQSSKIEDHAARVQGNSNTISDYMPLLEGGPFEEFISANTQVIHYFSDKITINAEPDSPAPAKTAFDDLRLLKVMPVADVTNENENVQSGLPLTNDNGAAQTILPVTDGKGIYSVPIVDDNPQPSFSMADDKSLFGEDISLPPDLDEEDFPSVGHSPQKNQQTVTSIDVSLPKIPPPTAHAKSSIPPKYPKVNSNPARSAGAKNSSPKIDGLRAPFPMKHENGIMYDISGRRLQQSSESCSPIEEDEVIEQIEGDPYDLDEDVLVQFKLETPPSKQSGQTKKAYFMRTEGLVNSLEPQNDTRRNLDPCEGGTRENPCTDDKKLEPPGYRAGAKEPKGRRGRDPELKSSSQKSRKNSGMRQNQPGTVRLQQQPPCSEQPRYDDQGHREHPKIARLQKPPAHQSSYAGCGFIPQEGFIPQAVVEEMHSDFNSFWNRQKNFVESSWASLIGVV